MGSCFECERFDNAAPVQEQFDERVEELREIDGHQEGYSGDFQTTHGLEVTREVFGSDGEAEEWLFDNTEKYNAAKAVKVEEPGGDWHWLVGGVCVC